MLPTTPYTQIKRLYLLRLALDPRRTAYREIGKSFTGPMPTHTSNGCTSNALSTSMCPLPAVVTFSYGKCRNSHIPAFVWLALFEYAVITRWLCSGGRWPVQLPNMSAVAPLVPKSWQTRRRLAGLSLPAALRKRHLVFPAELGTCVSAVHCHGSIWDAASGGQGRHCLEPSGEEAAMHGRTAQGDVRRTRMRLFERILK
ncbi:hypothetical protein C8Q73DRAFT_527012 [Cubamyces lactineus]|nr:hypothetical protein C8Q73DRAFT_527012 [Cubamyces lactineus]